MIPKIAKLNIPLLYYAAAAVMMLFSACPIIALAAESNQVTNFNIAIQQVFAVEFYTDQNVVYSEVVPFTNVDSRKPMVYADGRRENDGKSDVGIICMSNSGNPWYLKIHARPSLGLPAENIKYYVDQPYDRNTGGRAGGTLSKTPNWYSFSINPTTVYTSGASDQSNLPFGTLVTFNYALNPSGLDAGKAYSAAVTYTMTTTP